MEFTKTEKRQRKLVRDGYMYVFKKMLVNDKGLWECILWRKDIQCRATVKLSTTEEFIEQVNDQIHANSPAQVELKKIKVGMKYKAKPTEETVQQILGKQLRDISENAAANLSSIATMRWNIWKARGYDNIPQIPLNPEGTLVLPNTYQLTKYREPFLMFDSGEEDPKRILTSEIGIHILSESEH